MADLDVVKRLSLIRYMYDLAEKQSLQPLPNNAISILTFHDCVELFLDLLLIKNDIWKNDIKFREYFSELEKAGIKVSGQASMMTLNTARNGLKHHGIIPSNDEVQKDRKSTFEFLSVNCLAGFDFDFSDISMIAFVEYEQARYSLEKATAAFSEHRNNDVAKYLALSFAQIIDQHLDKHHSIYSTEVFPFQPYMHEAFVDHGIVDKKAGEIIRKLVKDRNDIQLAMSMMCLGIDLRKYQQFVRLTPRLHKNLAGDYIMDIVNNRNLLDEEFRFCQNFVIEVALLIQSFSTQFD
jgi:hypothetical protein